MQILLQGLAQPSLTENKDVVQTLPSNGPDRLSSNPATCDEIEFTAVNETKVGFWIGNRRTFVTLLEMRVGLKPKTQNVAERREPKLFIREAKSVCHEGCYSA